MKWQLYTVYLLDMSIRAIDWSVWDVVVGLTLHMRQTRRV